MISTFARLFRTKRRGAVMVFTALFITAAVMTAALVVDVGYVTTTQTQLQAAADAAALAGGNDLTQGLTTGATLSQTATMALVRQDAVAAAAANYAGNATTVYCNSSRDVTFGNAVQNSNGSWTMTPGATPYNMVTVNLLRNQTGSTAGDGPLPLLFSGMLGASAKLSVSSTVAVFPGNTYQIPTGTSLSANVMPLVMDQTTWNQVLAGNGNGWTDSYTYNHSTGQVSSGSDGYCEGDCYPGSSGTGATRGCCGYGNTGNNVTTQGQQCVSGLGSNVLSCYSGNQMHASTANPLTVSGSPGMNTSLGSCLDQCIGQTRAIAICSNYSNGNYTVCKFVGVRVMAHTLNGSGAKHVWLQPAPLVDPCLVPSLTSTVQPDSVFAPAVRCK